MARTGERVDPYITCYFHVEIDGITEAIFRECTGLEIETEIMSFEEGGVNDRVHKLPVRTKYPNLSLKHGVTQSTELLDWYLKIVGGKIERRNMSLVLHDSQGNEARRWSFEGAYPIKWSGPGLKADENALAVETLEIVHEGMSTG